MGRPVLPTGEAKDVQVGVRFKPNDDKTVEQAMAKTEGVETKAEWIRRAAISMAERLQPKPPMTWEGFWGGLPFPQDEMHEKRVKFCLFIKWDNLEGVTVTKGTGHFFVRRSKKGFHLQIVSRYSPDREKVLDLTNDQTKMIKKVSGSGEFEFVLFDPIAQQS